MPPNPVKPGLNRSSEASKAVGRLPSLHPQTGLNRSSEASKAEHGADDAVRAAVPQSLLRGIESTAAGAPTRRGPSASIAPQRHRKRRGRTAALHSHASIAPQRHRKQSNVGAAESGKAGPQSLLRGIERLSDLAALRRAGLNRSSEASKVGTARSTSRASTASIAPQRHRKAPAAGRRRRDRPGLNRSSEASKARRRRRPAPTSRGLNRSSEASKAEIDGAPVVEAWRPQSLLRGIERRDGPSGRHLLLRPQSLLRGIERRWRLGSAVQRRGLNRSSEASKEDQGALEAADAEGLNRSSEASKAGDGLLNHAHVRPQSLLRGIESRPLPLDAEPRPASIAPQRHRKKEVGSARGASARGLNRSSEASKAASRSTPAPATASPQSLLRGIESLGCLAESEGNGMPQSLLRGIERRRLGSEPTRRRPPQSLLRGIESRRLVPGAAGPEAPQSLLRGIESDEARVYQDGSSGLNRSSEASKVPSPTTAVLAARRLNRSSEASKVARRGAPRVRGAGPQSLLRGIESRHGHGDVHQRRRASIAPQRHRKSPGAARPVHRCRASIAPQRHRKADQYVQPHEFGQPQSLLRGIERCMCPGWVRGSERPQSLLRGIESRLRAA